jgi:hypothetical protein
MERYNTACLSLSVIILSTRGLFLKLGQSAGSFVFSNKKIDQDVITSTEPLR